jgi:DNA polymerase-3 subunit alpha
MREGEEALLGGWITAMRRISTKNGGQMAFVTISDGNGKAEVTVFPRVLEAGSDSIDVDRFIVLRVSAGRRNGEVNLVAEEVLSLETLTKKVNLSVNVTLSEEEIDPGRLAKLQSFLWQHPGDTPFTLRVDTANGRYLVRAGKGYCVSPTLELQRGLEEIVGQGRVRVSEQRNGQV